jgi:regulator of cell morphogenesis and NO signaling
MKLYKVKKQFEHEEHPFHQLFGSIGRLQEEHVVLEAGLLELNGMAKAIKFKVASANLTEVIYDLRHKVVAYKKELSAHSSWEEKELFPLINAFFNENPGAFALIEQEHELAEQYIDAFLVAVDKSIGSLNQKEAEDTATYLLLAYNILADHFKKEEDIVASLADDINEYGY